MRQNARWILFELMKLSLVVALFAVIHARVMDTRYEVHASTGRLLSEQSDYENRLSGLEQSHSEADQYLEDARSTVEVVQEDLAHQSELIQEGRSQLNRLIESRTDAIENSLRAEVNRIEGSTFRQSREVTARVSSLELKIRRRPREMKERMIYPVVQLRGNGTVGSGVVISSEASVGDGPAVTYLLTAFHVVQEITEGQEDPTLVHDVKFVDPDTDGLRPAGAPATVLAFQADSDIALLKMDLPEPWPYVARLAPGPEVLDVSIFDPVYAVGCPLGNKPMPTVGEVSSQEKVVAGQNFWMINAPTFFGNSGGGVFKLGNGHLIGISSMIYTYGKSQPMVVPHMGLFVPLPSIRQWLGQEGFTELCENMTPEVEIQTAASSTEDSR